jgi:hypothetical protein
MLVHRIAAVAMTVLGALSVAGAAKAQTQVRIGDSIRGTLSADDLTIRDGSHYDCFALEPGRDVVTITESSGYFDAFMVVGTGRDCGDSMTVIASDDDSGNVTNARISQAFSDRRILIRVNSFTAGETGDYILDITAGAPDEAEQQGSMNALPSVTVEWEADADTCAGAYGAVPDVIDSVRPYGNIGSIDYAARLNRVQSQRSNRGGALDMYDIYQSNFVLIALGGFIDSRPEQVAEYLTVLANCDRAFNFNPVTHFN